MKNLPATTDQTAITQQIPTSAEVKQLLCPKASNAEIALFLKTCEASGLNPFMREIYLIKFKDSPASIVTGYQTYLQKAEESGLLDGWHVDLDDDENPTKATITIYRKDWSHPFTHTVYRAEVDTSNAKSSQKAPWVKMPRFMLIKCVIGQGMRLCLPNVFRGMPYLPEEITVDGTSEDLPSDKINNLNPVNAEFTDVDPPTEEPEEPDTSEPHSSVLSDEEFRTYRHEYFPLAASYFGTNGDRHSWQTAFIGKPSIKDWTAAEFKKAIDALKNRKPNQPSPPKETVSIEELINKFPSGTPLPAPLKDKDGLTFYLNTRFLTLDLESRPEIRKLIEGCQSSKPKAAQFIKAVGKAANWGETIGGRGKARKFIEALNMALEGFPDPEAYEYLIQTTFTALGVAKPTDGVYRLTDVTATMFDSWNQAINGAVTLTTSNYADSMADSTDEAEEADDDLPF